MLLWWQRGVIYQIYPLSFPDADDDGPGRPARHPRTLDYLE